MTPPFDEQRHDSGAAHVAPEQDAAHSEPKAAHRRGAPSDDPEAPVTPAAEGSDTSEPEGPEAEHEQLLERDLDELAAKAQKADEYLELAKRTRADFENYRKRAAREAASAQQRGVVKLVRELLPAVDNLDRALEAVKAPDESNNGEELVSGIKLVHAELIAALARAGVDRFDPEGQRFDPQFHEAVGQARIDGAQPGTIIEVYQRGYRLGDSVIRPARVLVAG
jgi:molecular chaperone GrpE